MKDTTIRTLMICSSLLTVPGLAQASISEKEVEALDGISHSFEALPGKNIGNCPSFLISNRNSLEKITVAGTYGSYDSSGGFSIFATIDLGNTRDSEKTGMDAASVTLEGIDASRLYKNNNYIDANGYVTVVSREYKRVPILGGTSNTVLQQVSLKRIGPDLLRMVTYISREDETETTSHCLYKPMFQK